MTLAPILAWLEARGSEANRAGMARYGIATDRAFGVSVADLRAHAKTLGRDHARAAALWRAGWRETRLLALFTAERERVSMAQMERWVADLDSWDVCDTLCQEIFTPRRVTRSGDRLVDMAWTLAPEWAERPETFVRRAGLVLHARLARMDRASADARFGALVPGIADLARDDRRHVAKAASWALREIGQRSPALHGETLALAERLRASDDKAARWVGGDVRRQLVRPRARARAGVG